MCLASRRSGFDGFLLPDREDTAQNAIAGYAASRMRRGERAAGFERTCESQGIDGMEPDAGMFAGQALDVLACGGGLG